jgi:endonuclease G
MKKILLVLSLFLFPLIVEAQNDTLIVRPTFEVFYSQKKKQPLKLTYNVIPTVCKADRKGLDFFEEKGVITSTDADYVNNDWDKGHLAPAASFCGSKPDISSTFSYLNCALQHYKLNRGPWKDLEAKEREWCNIQPLVVTIEVVYDVKPNVLPSGADIPDGFTKKVKFTRTGEVKTFYFPNTECSGPFTNYQK